MPGHVQRKKAAGLAIIGVMHRLQQTRVAEFQSLVEFGKVSGDKDHPAWKEPPVRRVGRASNAEGEGDVMGAHGQRRVRPRVIARMPTTGSGRSIARWTRCCSPRPRGMSALIRRARPGRLTNSAPLTPSST